MTDTARCRMRKGTPISWDDEIGWIEYHDDNVHPILFAIYDQRIARGGHGLHTRVGTWMNDKPTTELSQRFFAAQYRPYPAPTDFATWDQARNRIARTTARPNFNLFSGSLAEFWRTNAFLEEPFRTRHRVGVSEVLYCLGVLTVLSSMTGEALLMRNRLKRTARILYHQTDLRFRAYWCVALDLDGVAELIVDAAPILGFKNPLPQERVRRTLDFFALDRQSASNIGLWSGGKRPLLIPLPDRGYMLDLVAVMPILVGLFFGIPVDGPTKGAGFEEAARQAFRDGGLDVAFSGELHWTDNSVREADAIVRLGDRLLVVECVAVEEPVDLELSKPSVFANRKERLGEKLQQARTLAARLKAAPSGKNFDFTWARRIDWRVVCPHHEFAWDVGDDFFDDIGEPRILTVAEALEFNLTLSAKAAGIKGRLLRERGEPARPHPIPRARETPKSLTHRLKAKVDALAIVPTISARLERRALFERSVLRAHYPKLAARTFE